MQCTGPVPSIEQVALRDPAEPGQPYEVDVQVRNRWRGHGEIQLTAQLRDTANGRNYVGQQNAVMQGGETIRVMIPVRAEKGEYEPRVEVEYPPK